MAPKKSSIVAGRQKQEKFLMIEQLEKTPIVQIACEKTGISRATYYRWLKDDKEFCKHSREALQKGISIMNDLAESQLLRSVKDGNLTGIIFWLKSRHSSYGSRIEITAGVERGELTSEEKKIVQSVLKKYKKLS
ncbi:MAG: phBC6A51 family helix-turn-helix protein [Candidatus Gracilibacteria bacterium]|nr:phBC6A51 family helix-turn-helix protein [Candidatus Gracilibacteria bacterium]